MHAKLFSASLTSVLIICAASTASAQQNFEPVPPGFDFPADEATLLRFRDTQNIVEMRRHSWYVFAGLTQRAKNGEAIWETWFPARTTFAPSLQPESAAAGPPVRTFEQPNQFRMRAGRGQPEAIGESVLSFVMFNKDAHEFIRTNRFHQQTRLNEINRGFPAGTPVEKRDITPFPRTAMSLKLVWRIVRQSNMTLFPVWDGRPTQSDALGNPPSTWARVVLVDPVREDIPATETRPVNWRGNPNFPARVVSVKRFYHFKVSDAQLAAIQAVVGPANVSAGDFAVLTAMHYTTKEIPDWVWSTFWWHDEPDSGQFGSDRPTIVPGVWRNYRMDTAFHMETPREFDGSPDAVFNPYLENFSGGMGSNCMTCHRQARWTNDGNPGFEVTRGELKPDNPMFRDALKLDFLWSIPDRAQ